MLRSELAAGPFALGHELHTHEVSDFPVDTVADHAMHSRLGVLDYDIAIGRHGSFYLEAGAVRGDILQQRCSPMVPAGGICPADIHHIRAQDASLSPPFVHTLIIDKIIIGFSLNL